jgi:hypothetical protein
METSSFQAISLSLNIVVIGIQVPGIVLCLVGWRKHDTIGSVNGLNVLLTVILVFWGSWIVYIAWFTVFSGQPHEKLLWMKNPVAVTSFAAWTLKGIIGVTSGLVFTTIALMKKLKRRTMNPEE